MGHSRDAEIGVLIYALGFFLITYLLFGARHLKPEIGILMRWITAVAIIGLPAGLCTGWRGKWLIIKIVAQTGAAALGGLLALALLR